MIDQGDAWAIFITGVVFGGFIALAIGAKTMQPYFEIEARYNHVKALYGYDDSRDVVYRDADGTATC